MHIAYLHSLLEELASRGIAADRLVASVPGEISPEGFARLFLRARNLSGDPAIGLALGMRLNLASHGALGYALMSCRDGDQLMSGLTRFARLSNPNLTLIRQHDAQRFMLVCRLDVPGEHREVLVDLTLATLVNAARALFNQRIPGAEVWVDFPPPSYAGAYEMLRIPVRFNQPRCALVCEPAFLDMPLPSANPVLAEIGNRQCQQMLVSMRQRAGLGSEVRALLLRSTSGFPSQAATARHFNLSTRSLRRRLCDEDTGYREILDEVRYELARRYLETGALPITEIAVLLGYEDPANFRRAFRRWSGTSAIAYRTRPPGSE